MDKRALVALPPPAGILTLPNELLCDIASPLCTADLRRLSRVNHKFNFFAYAYLNKYHYNKGLVTLPNELLLVMVQHLDTRSCSSLAQTSHRFYPLVMNYIVRHDIRYRGSSLLNVAAKRNLKGLAKNVLRMGGDVNTQSGFQQGLTGKRPTPLAAAAFFGYERMVRLFLAAGAEQIVDGTRLALVIAFARDHENIAILLSQDLDAYFQVLKSGSTLLDTACEKRFVKLVRFLLERQDRSLSARDVRGRSLALYNIIDATACKGDFVMRQLLEDVHQIVSMLLQHHADPDMPSGRIGATARDVASRHPDPRVRNLLSKAKPPATTKPKKLPSRAGRKGLDNESTPSYQMEYFHSMESPIPSRFATLLDFVDKPDTAEALLTGDDGSTQPELDFEDPSLETWNLAHMVGSDMRGLPKQPEADPKEPPTISSFSQLGTPKAIKEDVTQAFWAQKPAPVKSAPLPRPSVSKAKELPRPVVTDPFPHLGQPVRVPRARGTDLWSRFQKTNEPDRERPQQRALTSDDSGKQSKQSSSKKSKKKQWVPLKM
ncbi:ankyrin [Ophiobolus disseminans]|uniref:Ankyrin n=1 Tax=Ophiobolus disseminans TaxID=1469910 RepID=A0A6A7AKS9_9PLEO|nr:ankyrin [Ophiobolus disseminans]